MIMLIISGCATTNRAGHHVQTINENLTATIRNMEHDIDSLAADSLITDSVGFEIYFNEAISPNDICRGRLTVPPNAQIAVQNLAEDINDLTRSFRNIEQVLSYGSIRQDFRQVMQFYEMQLENNFRMRERLLQLLNNTTDLQEILEVERELDRLNDNIGTLKTQIFRMLAEAGLAGMTSSAVGHAGKKPSLFETFLFYACMGLSWLMINK
jgi:hypothetical protein